MSDAGESDLRDRLERYLARQWSTRVRVLNLRRMPGGASRETFSFDAAVEDRTRGLVLRRDPPAGLLATDRRVEYLAYKSFQGIVPVPEAVLVETDPGQLDRPFFIMSRIEGGRAPSAFAPSRYGAHAQAIGEAIFGMLGRIARTEVDTLPIAECFEAPRPEACWREALDHWESVLIRNERHPQPIVRAAIRRLRRNPPAPAARIAVVHGDYRSGNFLHDGQGRILAVLDWEMVHLGDPVEDIAWCCDPLFGHFDERRVAGAIREADAIAAWEKTSGLRIDPASLKWWKLFSAVKGQAIWTTAANELISSPGDLNLAISTAYPARRHDVVLATALAERVEEGWA